MLDQEVKMGFREAQKITKNFAKSFYLASFFLPQEKKLASYAVYAICRISDETVDATEDSSREKHLSQLEQNITAVYTNQPINAPLLKAFRQTVKNYQIPKEYFSALIEGMRMDLRITRYPDFTALYAYCYRVAGVIGLIMLKIFGYKDNTAENYAVKLGIAMQLTNILRDIQEDLNRGRIYLPQDELTRFHVSEQELLQTKNTEEFKELMRFQISRARRLYAESLPGVKLIDHRVCRFVVLSIKETYSGILQKIEKNNYDIFTKRAYVDTLRKLLIIIQLLAAGEYR